MNRQVAGLALIVAAAGFCVAQNPAAIAGHLPFHSELSAIVQSEPQSSASAQNATVIRIVLSKSLDAKKLKEGDPVEAKTETELSANGLVAPRGSVIKGHVTQASARSKGGQQSSLGIAFDAIVLKNGQPMPLKTSIQAVGAPPTWVRARWMANLWHPLRVLPARPEVLRWPPRRCPDRPEASLNHLLPCRKTPVGSKVRPILLL